MPNLLELPPVSLPDLAVALLLGLILSSITAWQYVRFGRTLTNRVSLAYTLPIVTLTIVLIITIVKASIALSLGLCRRALHRQVSDTHQRTEELAYLFIAIGAGIGLGANQVLATTSAILFILVAATARRLFWDQTLPRNLYVSVEVAGDVGDQDVYRSVLRLLEPHIEEADLRRLDVGKEQVQVTLYVKVRDDQALAEGVTALNKGLPGDATITFIDQESSAVSW